MQLVHAVHTTHGVGTSNMDRERERRKESEREKGRNASTQKEGRKQQWSRYCSICISTDSFNGTVVPKHCSFSNQN